MFRLRRECELQAQKDGNSMEKLHGTMWENKEMELPGRSRSGYRGCLNSLLRFRFIQDVV